MPHAVSGHHSPPETPQHYGVGVFIRGEAPAERLVFVPLDRPPTYVPPAPLP